MAKKFNGLAASFGSAVPDIFVDDITGFDSINGTIRLDLATIVRKEPIPPSDASCAIVARLILPLESAKRLSIGLFDYLEKIGANPKGAINDGSSSSTMN